VDVVKTVSSPANNFVQDGGRHVSAQYGPIERRSMVTIRFTEGRKINVTEGSEEEIRTEVNEVSKGKTSSFGKAFLQDTSLPSLDSRRFQDADFKQKTALSRARYGSVGILPAHARRVDAPRRM